VVPQQVIEARWYEQLDDGRVRCHLCAHRCVIGDGKLGICRVRRNDAGTLHTLVYGRTISQNVDPIEKKPLYHVEPGSLSFSIATPGCNFRCDFCQNADISQMPRERHLVMGHPASPAQIATAAERQRCRSIAYTYTEPTIFSEYALDVAKVAHGAGLLNVYVTNGYMTRELLDDLHPYLDAANVDLKAFRDTFYQNLCGARLDPVLQTLRDMKELGIWVEVTTLVIPTVNDSDEVLEGISEVDDLTERAALAALEQLEHRLGITLERTDVGVGDDQSSHGCRRRPGRSAAAVHGLPPSRRTATVRRPKRPRLQPRTVTSAPDPRSGHE